MSVRNDSPDTNSRTTDTRSAPSSSSVSTPRCIDTGCAIPKATTTGPSCRAPAAASITVSFQTSPPPCAMISTP